MFVDESVTYVSYDTEAEEEDLPLPLDAAAAATSTPQSRPAKPVGAGFGMIKKERGERVCVWCVCV